MKFGKLISYSVIASISMMIISGCASNQSAQQKIKKERAHLIELRDEDIASNIGNIQGLYDAWIKPRLAKEGMLETDLGSGTTLGVAGILDIEDGIARFCRESKGILQESKRSGENGDRGTDYFCKSPDGSLIGQLTVMSYSNGRQNWLGIYTNLNEMIVKNEKLYQERLQKNGPTGRVFTTAGNYKFYRIGDLDHRTLLQVKVKFTNLSEKFVGIEDIRRIEYSEKCCDLKITLNDGRTGTANTINFSQLTSRNRTENFSFLNFVFKDGDNGQLYTKKVITDQIKIIEIDDKQTWMSKPNDVLIGRPENWEETARIESILKYQRIALTKSPKGTIINCTTEVVPVNMSINQVEFDCPSLGHVNFQTLQQNKWKIISTERPKAQTGTYNEREYGGHWNGVGVIISIIIEKY